MMIRSLVCLLLLLFPLTVRPANFYAATNGLPANTGAIGSPWDLQTAMLKTNSIVGGDTLWIRQGTYGHSPQGFIPVSSSSSGNEGVIFYFNLFGTSSNSHVSVRPYTNEHVIIDGGAWAQGATNFHTTSRPSFRIGISGGRTTFGNYVWFYDLEFASTSTTSRNAADDSTFPTDIPRSSGPFVYGDGVKFIDCTFHDNSTGIETWSDAADLEMNGCVFWNNGWKGIPANHGHGVYAQTYNSSTPGKRWINNLFVNAGYDNSGQWYGSGTVETSHHRISSNIFSGSPNHGRIMVGVRDNTTCILDRIQDVQVASNIGYGIQADLAFHADNCAYKDVIFTNNYFRGSQFQLFSWKTGTMTNNVFFDNSFMLGTSGRPAASQVLSVFTNGTFLPWDLDRNTYFLTTAVYQGFNLQGNGPKNITNWRSLTGYDANTVINTTYPTTNFVRYQTHDYNANRVNVAINNWTEATTVTLNFTGAAWSPGDAILIRNGANYYGDVTNIVLNTSTNAVYNMRAAAHSVAVPFGDVAPLNPTSFPYFGAIEVERTLSTPPPPPPTFTTTINSVNPASGVAITVSPADISGLSNGTTTFLRTNTQDVITSLTAPATSSGNTFASWTRNGVLYSTSRAITYTNVAASVFSAVYATPPAVFIVTISSINPASAVTITNSPVDNGGLGNGATSFTRTNNQSVVSSITAPATASGNTFNRWERNGVAYSVTRATTFTNIANVSFTAIYDTPPPPPTTFTTAVNSVNPASGVTITVSPNDNAGLGNGSTSFVRTNNQNVVTTMTAPGTASGNTFTNWTRNGIFYSSSAGITYTNVSNAIFAAAYATPPAIYIVTIGSANPASGITITNSPVDNGSLGNGSTPFTRTNNESVVTTITAPASASGNTFSQWQRNGVSYSLTRATTFTNSGNASFVAIYTTPAPPTTFTLSVTSVNPSSGLSVIASPNDNGGLSTGSTPFIRTNNINVVTTLTAPATNGLGLFSAWQLNGTNYSTSAVITKTNVANDTLTAIYVTPTFDITIDQSGAGGAVNVAMSPSDILGASNGSTTFTRTYNTNTIVTLTLLSPAPNGNLWSEWLYNGVSYSTSQSITVTNTLTLGLTTVYVPRPLTTNAVSSRMTRRRP